MPEPTSPREPAWQIVERGAEQGAYPGAVALVRQGGRTLLHRATGWAVVEPAAERTPMRLDTLFDLASLTKVVATLPAILRLVADGALTLDSPLGAVLPAFGLAGAKRAVTIRWLLAHNAGLDPWRPLYLDHTGPEAYLAAIAASQPGSEPGAGVAYSDLGFILLGGVVRRLSGRTIAVFARERIFAPLGLQDLLYTPPETMRPRIAATERGNATEIAMCGARAAGFDRWRTGIIRGQVNDGNAWYGLSGVSGHAGLFGTADTVARYGEAWLRAASAVENSLLPPRLIAAATRPQAAGRGLGWEVRSPGTRANNGGTGRGFGPRAFGHTGFTGTSLWLDPDRDLVAVLLTNRLHPEARPAIAEIRPAFHAAIAAALPMATP